MKDETKEENQQTSLSQKRNMTPSYKTKNKHKTKDMTYTIKNE